MTLSWAWLVLVVAITTASTTSQLPGVEAIHLYADERGFRGGNIPGNNDVYYSSNNNVAVSDQAGTDTCPQKCRCGTEGLLPPRPGQAPYPFTVNCTGQGLMSWPSGVWPDTEVLELSHNKLQSLEALTGPPHLNRLRKLDLSHNWLGHLDNAWLFEHVAALRDLSLSDNGLRMIQHGSFNGLRELRTLDLSRNLVRTIELHAFAGLTQLQVLRLDRNDLYQVKREWFMGLTSLTSLYLNDNHIADLEVNLFDRLSHLQHLDLSDNALRAVPNTALTGLTNLRLLNLSGNFQLREVPGVGDPQLREVAMTIYSGNASTEGESPNNGKTNINTPTSFTSPSLSPPSSSSGELSHLPALSILLMDGIAPSRLPSLSVSGLRVAELSMSFLPRLRVVDKWAFRNLSNLHTLQLHDNPRLVFLHPDAFSGLPALRHLHLHNNALMALSQRVPASLPSLTDLQLHHNPLHCDCNIYWLRQELGLTLQHHHHSQLRQPNTDSSIENNNSSISNGGSGIGADNSNNSSSSNSGSSNSGDVNSNLNAPSSANSSFSLSQPSPSPSLSSSPPSRASTPSSTSAYVPLSNNKPSTLSLAELSSKLSELASGLSSLYTSPTSSSSSSSSDHIVPAPTNASSSSNILGSRNITLNNSSNKSTVTSSSNSNSITTSNSSAALGRHVTVISEPGRVACYFPSGGAPIPLQQLPLQYFPPTCPPVALALFPATLNLSLGAELWLECHGLGVPTPSVSWILPGGYEINATSTPKWPDGSGKTTPASSVRVVGETRLHIAALTLADSGPYGCRASNAVGDDFSSTVVLVLNKPLRLVQVEVGGDHITVSWRGSIPRPQMSQFQLVYRSLRPSAIEAENARQDDATLKDGGKSGGEEEDGSAEVSGYRVVFLHGSIHKCTITGLEPRTTYEVCLVYRRNQPVHCQNYTTTTEIRRVAAPAGGIVRVSGSQIAVGMACVLGFALLVVSVALVRKLRHRKDYRDPLAEEEKAAIPLEGLAPNAPSTPLTSSRTALLTNSQT
ncbi:uncharacterized protein LOC101852916 [Aplysia californica]|uniref:Uncharacterized protein LOC101852916 n=1 Tax=Aplysia californica TaxID=6500 RepID=A0ABM0JKC4_APLCA|nr:uncharacterized protein LOC101852916 [Aplysia californica]